MTTSLKPLFAGNLVPINDDTKSPVVEIGGTPTVAISGTPNVALTKIGDIAVKRAKIDCASNAAVGNQLVAAVAGKKLCVLGLFVMAAAPVMPARPCGANGVQFSGFT